MAVSKSHIVEIVAKQEDLTKRQANDIVNLIFDTIQDSLVRGERVSVVSFGTFEVRTNKARMGRNPKTGESIHIPDRKSVKFTVGTGLKQMAFIPPTPPLPPPEEDP